MVVCSWLDLGMQVFDGLPLWAPLNDFSSQRPADLSVRQSGFGFTSEGRLKSRIVLQPSEGTHERYRSTR